mmetsp:Transcript_37727/g.57767  ORF Transcript_37727/g.57767 Transcript_37727/m.57767 type:complete len:198 (+) Transcript_37727:3451-4044(+)
MQEKADTANDDDEEWQEGYTLEKSIIMDAWARYRPVQKEGEGERAKAKEIKDLKAVFSESFINKVMANTHLKIYDFCASSAQKLRKKSFKNDFIRIYKERLADEELEKRKRKEREGDVYEEEVDPKNNIPEEEIELIENFLKGFILSSDSGSKKDQIDIKLALKALPSKVDDQNVLRCELFNFEDTKKSLIAFQNNN